MTLEVKNKNPKPKSPHAVFYNNSKRACGAELIRYSSHGLNSVDLKYTSLIMI